MNRTNSRKYAQVYRKKTAPTKESSNKEFSVSVATALGILGGTFLAGLISGKLLSRSKKSHY